MIRIAVWEVTAETSEDRRRRPQLKSGRPDSDGMATKAQQRSWIMSDSWGLTVWSADGVSDGGTTERPQA